MLKTVLIPCAFINENIACALQLAIMRIATIWTRLMANIIRFFLFIHIRIYIYNIWITYIYLSIYAWIVRLCLYFSALHRFFFFVFLLLWFCCIFIVVVVHFWPYVYMCLCISLIHNKHNVVISLVLLLRFFIEYVHEISCDWLKQFPVQLQFSISIWQNVIRCNGMAVFFSVCKMMRNLGLCQVGGRCTTHRHTYHIILNTYWIFYFYIYFCVHICQ